MVTYEDIKHALTEVGIEPGDIVYVASFVAMLGNREGLLHDTIAALMSAVGAEGTVVMPTFNFGFCHGELFDKDRTESTTGVLTEAFRQHPRSRRMIHPPYHSVSAMGKHSEEIEAIRSRTSFGRESVFHWLYEREAKHLLLGCGHREGVTHFHWLEEIFEVPYRFWKQFRGLVRENGRVEERTYDMYARRLDMDSELGDIEPLGWAFEDAGFVEQTPLGYGRVKAFALTDFYEFMAPKIRADKLLLVRPREANAG